MRFKLIILSIAITTFSSPTIFGKGQWGGGGGFGGKSGGVKSQAKGQQKLQYQHQKSEQAQKILSDLIKMHQGVIKNATESTDK